MRIQERIETIAGARLLRPRRTAQPERSVVLVMLLLMPAVTPAMEERARGPSQHTVIVIRDFSRRGTDPRHENFRSDLPQMLQIALKTYDLLEIIPEAKLLRGDRVVKTLGDKRMEARTELPSEVLSRVGADYVLDCGYLTRQLQIRLSCSLENVKGGGSKRLRPISMNVDDVFIGMHRLSRELIQALSEPSLSPRVAVACFANESRSSKGVLLWKQSPQKRSEWIAPDLASSLATLLRDQRAFEIVDWSEVKTFCGLDVGVAELARRLEAEAVIAGRYRLRGEDLTISPEFYIAALDRTIGLPETECGLDGYLDARVQLADRLKSFVGGARDPEGNWKIEEGIRQLGPDGYIARAGQLVKEGDLELARYYLSQALAERPDDPTAHYQLGLLLTKQERFAEAARELAAAIEARPAFPAAHMALGRAYHQMGRHEQALKSYETALHLDPDLEGIRVALGSLYALTDRPDRAREYFQQALEVDAPSAYYWLGLLAAEEGRHEEAVEMWSASLEADPDNERTRQGLSLLYLEKGRQDLGEGDYEGAIRNLGHSIEVTHSFDAHLWRGIAYRRLGPGRDNQNYLKALSDFRSALESGDPEVDWGTFEREAALLNLTELCILTSAYGEAREWAAISLERIDEGRWEHVIARFLQVTALVLDGLEFEEARLFLQVEAKKSGASLAEYFDFDVIEGHVTSGAVSDEGKREVLLTIIGELRRIG